MSKQTDIQKVSQPKRALVLGCGGVAGGAWSIAALHNLQRQLQWDPRDADVIIGTSVGAVLAALLRSGVSVEQLVACQREDGASVWNHDQDSGGRFPPLPRLRFTAPKLLLKGLKGEVSPLTAVSSVVPQGNFDMTPFRRLIDRVAPEGRWPAAETWLMAVDVESGGRVALGQTNGPVPNANLADAVCASYGVPGWCPPVEINGRVYIDGGVASPTSADFLLNNDIDEVIILAPMASSNPDKPRSRLAKVERAARRYMTKVVDSEVAALKAAGKTVIRLEPQAEDLRSIGYNMMDPARRRRVFVTAMLTTLAAVMPS